jgi:hypothetical protein
MAAVPVPPSGNTPEWSRLPILPEAPLGLLSRLVTAPPVTGTKNSSTSRDIDGAQSGVSTTPPIQQSSTLMNVRT